MPRRVTPDDPLAHAEELLRSIAAHHLPVVEAGRLVGVLSERDLLAARLSFRHSDAGRRQRHLDEVRVAEVMSANPVTVAPDTELVRAAELLVHHRFSCVPVVQGEVVVGILTSTDLLRLAADFLGREAEQQSQPTPVSRLMTPRPLSTLTAADRLDLASILMRHERHRHLPVLDEAERLVGMLSDHDLLAALRSRLEPLSRIDRLLDKASITVGEVMSRAPEAADPEAAAEAAARLLLARGIHALPVLRDGQLVGILTDTDFIAYVAGCYPRAPAGDGGDHLDVPRRRPGIGPC